MQLVDEVAEEALAGGDVRAVAREVHHQLVSLVCDRWNCRGNKCAYDRQKAEGNYCHRPKRGNRRFSSHTTAGCKPTPMKSARPMIVRTWPMSASDRTSPYATRDAEGACKAYEKGSRSAESAARLAERGQVTGRLPAMGFMGRARISETWRRPSRRRAHASRPCLSHLPGCPGLSSAPPSPRWCRHPAHQGMCRRPNRRAGLSELLLLSWPL